MRFSTRRLTRLTNPFRLDGRSLALFRILIAVLVIIDCGTRLSLVAVFLGSGGLPDPADPSLFPAWLWSVHRLHGDLSTAIALLWLQIGVAVAVLLGWHSRLSFGALTLLTLSLHNGNPYILDGGDRCLIVMMIWACFLPLGQCWALDRRQQPAAAVGPANRSGFTVTGLAAMVFTLQIVMIYWLTVSAKSIDHWLIQRDAVWFALNLDHLANRLGTAAARFTTFTSLGSVITYGIQVLAPLALILPTGRWQIRMAGLGALAVMHLGFIPFLELGLFPWINLSGLVALIPGEFWDALGIRQQPSDRRRAMVPRHRLLETLRQPLLGLLISLALLTTITDRPAGVAPGLEPIKALGIHQHWRMFAPLPNPVDVWFELVDVSPAAAGSPTTPTRLVLPNLQPFNAAGNPRRQGLRLHTQRWRKFIDNLASHRLRPNLARSYVRHLCLQARRSAWPPSGRTWRLDRVEEPTGPLGQPPLPLRRQAIGAFRCR